MAQGVGRPRERGRAACAGEDRAAWYEGGGRWCARAFLGVPLPFGVGALGSVLYLAGLMTQKR
jgi:hypothetical protein